MNRSTVSRMVAAGSLLVALGCTKDPLASLRAGPARLIVSSKTLTVNVRDSVAVTATVVDEQGNPLPDPASATSISPTIVSVSTASGAPLPQSKFFIKGLAFGRGTVNVTVGSITVPITVISYPATVRITGGVDSANSGATLVLTAEALSATGTVVTIPSDSIRWSSDDLPVATVTTPGTTTTVSAKSPGVAIITVTLPGGASTTLPVRVVPGPFAGSLSASSGGAATTVTASAGAGPGFTTASTVTVGGEATYVTARTATTLTFVVPPSGTAGSKEVVFSNMGPDALSLRTTFSITGNPRDDTYEPGNNDPTTSPAISANGDYFVVLHGACAPPGVGPAGSDCDDFFSVTNTTAATINVTFNAAWLSGADVDLIFCTGACALAAEYPAFAFDAATSANPEVLTVPITPGQTMRVWLNVWDAHGAAHSLSRLRVSGIP